jgi:hypothetical protein
MRCFRKVTYSVDGLMSLLFQGQTFLGELASSRITHPPLYMPSYQAVTSLNKFAQTFIISAFINQ